MIIRCKIVSVVLKWAGRDAQNGPIIDASVTLTNSKDGDGNSINAVLWAGDPVAVFELKAIRQEIAEQLIPGADYYMDISPVE